MLDIKFVRENLDSVKNLLSVKGFNLDREKFLELDGARRNLIKKIEELRGIKNQANEEIKNILRQKKDPAQTISKMKETARRLDVLEENFRKLKKEFDVFLLDIPNIPHQSSPQGNISLNRTIKQWGVKKEFDFTPLTHIELAEQLDIIDFKRASKISASGFALFKGNGARLTRALINFMLDIHTDSHNYKEIFPPFIVNAASMTTTGQLPRMEQDMYELDEHGYYLIPTAEVPVTSMHRNETFNESELPVYYAAYTACFRKEAGSYGKETKGLMRVHQFDKVELVKFTKPDESYQELEKLLDNACKVIELLEIPYRVVLLATEDLSFAATKCYDIEIHAPGVDKYLEVSSCSNFEDFQARRGNIRYRDEKSKKINFVHTLNGSGVALARLIASILENYQQKNGSIVIPQVLKPYMGGKELIEK